MTLPPDQVSAPARAIVDRTALIIRQHQETCQVDGYTIRPELSSSGPTFVGWSVIPPCGKGPIWSMQTKASAIEAIAEHRKAWGGA